MCSSDLQFAAIAIGVTCYAALLIGFIMIGQHAAAQLRQGISMMDLLKTYPVPGWHLALGGAVTRPGARRPRMAARAIPGDRLLLETDAPDQTPAGVPPDERRCEPGHLPLIARAVAAARGESLEALAARTTANAQELFRVSPGTPM